MTPQEITEAKKEIDNMSHCEMARIWRFAPDGHPYFNARNIDLYEYFAKRFKELGGMTPEISKVIGWE